MCPFLKTKRTSPISLQVPPTRLECFTRHRLSLAASTAIAKETIVNLKWGHLEDNWEIQDIPHISIPSELIKGHGRGRYKGVRQETFLTPEAKKDLLTYREWIERKTGRKVTEEDYIYIETRTPYRPLSYQRLGGFIWELSKRAGIPFSLHDCRRYVETALEEARIPPNWCRKIRGRKVRGEENPYSRPEIEKLREAFRDAVPLLEFTKETPSLSKEEMRKQHALDEFRLAGVPEGLVKEIEDKISGKTFNEALPAIREMSEAFDRIMEREGLTPEILEELGAVMIPKEAIEREIEKIRQEKSQKIAEIMMQHKNKERTQYNGDGPILVTAKKSPEKTSWKNF